MMGFRRRRSERAKPVRRTLQASPEALETRQLLSGNRVNPYLVHSVLLPDTRATHTPAVRFNHPYGATARQLSFLDNDGKILTGTDREGDMWQITVHGPGAVIVTDATPNDGALDDDLVSIQIVNSDPHKTFITGNVSASARVQSNGVVYFENLFAENGVHSIELNGFTLARTTVPNDGELANEGAEIYLPGGVGLLSFNDVFAEIDLAFNDQPIDIIIGRENSPLPFAPSIRIGSIFNTVYDSEVLFPEAGVPPTDPTVRILVNGEIDKLDMVSATGFAIDPPGAEFVFPKVATTGRTQIRTLAINHMKAVGSLRNTTVSRGPVPFANGQSGLRRLGGLKVGGVTDGLGIDVSQGNIGGMALARGLGDPIGGLPGDIHRGEPSTQFGNAAFGLMGGLITARRLGHLKVAPSSVELDVTQDPEYRQQDRTNWTKYYPRNGRALLNAAIVVDGSIGPVNIVGDAQNSEIKSGTNYRSILAGLEGERATSQIGRVRWRGHLVDSVMAATYRTGPDRAYGTADDTPGPGRINGELKHGYIYQNGNETVLDNTGAGFFARRKRGYLPPIAASQRVHSVNLDL